jgi:hypothetical protein
VCVCVCVCVYRYVNPKMTIPFLAHVQVFWVDEPANPADHAGTWELRKVGAHR